MIAGCVEGDCFLTFFVHSEFVDEDPVTLNMAIATSLPFSMKGVISVLLGKQFSINQLIHHGAQLENPYSFRSIHFLIIPTELLCYS